MKNIALIGMPASYKTAVGKKLAAKIGRMSVDTDRLVEFEAARSVEEIFSLYGEEIFRDLETKALARAVEAENAVISTGGGIVERAENLELLKNCCVIYLYASPAELVKRLSGARPLLAGDPEKKLRELYVRREPLYFAAADKKFSTNGKTSDAVAQEISRFLSRLPL